MSKQHVVGESPFMKRVLIPFWVVRILVMVVEIGLYALIIGAVAAASEKIDEETLSAYGANAAVSTILAIAAVIMIIIFICLALDIVCIVKRARRTLSPKFFLIVSVIQTVIWTILFVLSMLGARTGVSIAVGVIIYLSFLGVLIYASVVFHQYRTGSLRGAYAPTVNPALPSQHGLVANSEDYPSYPSYPAHAAYGDVPKPMQYELQSQPVQSHEYPSQYAQNQYPNNQHPNNPYPNTQHPNNQYQYGP